MNAIRTYYHAEPAHIMADIALSSKQAAVCYFTLGGQLPKLKHHREAAAVLLDKHYPDWRKHHALVSSWLGTDTYVHIAALKAELQPENDLVPSYWGKVAK